MKSVLTVTFAITVAAGMIGCRSIGGASCNEPAVYASADSIPALRAPPGLETPNTKNALRVPPLNEPEPPPRQRGDRCLDEPPPYSPAKPAAPAQ